MKKQVAYAIEVSLTEQQRFDLFGDAPIAVVEVSPERARQILSWHSREVGKNDYSVIMVLAAPDYMEIAHAFKAPCPEVEIREATQLQATA